MHVIQQANTSIDHFKVSVLLITSAVLVLSAFFFRDVEKALLFVLPSATIVASLLTLRDYFRGKFADN